MKKIVTNDGSITFFNEKVGEKYHSISGAKEEAIEKFVNPSRIIDFVKDKNNKEINILDICFGLGYNSAAAVEKIREINKDIKIFVAAFEIDEEIVESINKIEYPFNNREMFRSILKEDYDKNNTKIKLFLGDVKKEIKKTSKLNKKFNFVFFDPFSPKVQEDLWTKELFESIAKLCTKNAVLLTYSCARKVRENLKEAGFRVSDGPCVGRKSPSTVAQLI